jgi:GDPmannose 4,6-dehydratase
MINFEEGKVASLTGVNGQTGSFLAELLLEKGYKVFGMVRKSSTFNTERIEHIYNNPNLKLIYGDLANSSSVIDFVSQTRPDYFFNLGGLSHVRTSIDMPLQAVDVDGLGVVRCLEAIRKYSSHTRFLQASTSELFGNSPAPQNELTPMVPCSPYSIGKLTGYSACNYYNLAYGMFAVNAISFNHESARRNPTFVTRKITKTLAEIKLGLKNELHLGCLTAKRDFSHASDVAEAMYLMITADKPENYVISSGETYSIEQFLDMVSAKLELNWRDYIKFDERLLRPVEVNCLLGDSSKIRNQLNWKPKFNIHSLIDEMVEYDLKLAKQQLLIKNIG